MYHVKLLDLGFKDYKETWDYQKSVHEKLTERKAGNNALEIQPHMILVEHPHVFTLGKSGKEDNLLVDPAYLRSLGAGFYKTDRGGDITYHGPGQIVGYPILDLDALGMGVKQYIETLEQAIIDTLKEYHIEATALPGATGVWIDSGKPAFSRKICAIGVKVSRGITMHGFALNVHTDLDFYNHINPCGFSDKSVTSIEKELEYKPVMVEVKDKLLKHIRCLFNIELL